MTKSIANNSDRKYTIKEISEMIDVPKQTMLDTINRLFPEKMISRKTTYLTEEEVSMISKELKKAHNVICTGSRADAMTELEKKEQMFLGYKYAMEMYVEDQEEKKALQEKIALDAPKVEFYDEIMGSSTLISVAEVAKILGTIGEIKLFSLLRDLEVFDKNNIPYQQYMDKGWFKVIESKWTNPKDLTVNVRLTTKVTQVGLDGIRKLINTKM